MTDSPVVPPRWTPLRIAAIAGILGGYVLLAYCLTLQPRTPAGGYGMIMFAFGPLVLGFLVGMVYPLNPGTPWHRRALVLQVGTSVCLFLLSGLLLAIGFEGLICVAMAAPLVWLTAVSGAFVASLVRLNNPSPSSRIWSAMFAVSALAFLTGIEPALNPSPQVRPVVTVIDIDAAPEVVWKNVIAFPDLPSPTEWYFRAGIAAPIRAHIQGSGVGAVRYCNFTTGPFVEPITAWEENRRLAFDVTDNPAPMRELSPYAELETRHLDGYMVSKKGEFLLTPLPGGGTRLKGTTWYQHGLFPDFYWRWWSDAILHRIHLRVLNHIAHLSESPEAG